MNPKKDIQKIKTLLSHKDDSFRNMGFSLLDSYEDIQFVEELIGQSLEITEGTVTLKAAWKLRKDAERLLVLILKLLSQYSSESTSLQSIMKQVKIVRLMELSESQDIEGFSQLYSCQILCFYDTNLFSCEKLSNLRKLEIFQAPDVEDVSALRGTKLHRLLLGDMPKLNNIDDLAECSELRELLFLNCPALTNFDVLSKLPNLKKIHLPTDQISLLSESLRRQFFS